MTKNHIEFVLSGYGVPYTDALADKLLEMFDEEAASYQHTINELNKALSVPEREKETDLISRDELLNEILTNFDMERCDYATDEFIGIIVSMPSAIPKREKGTDNKWIPVSEWLPVNTEYVLATDGLDMFVAWHNPDKGWGYPEKGWHSFDENFDAKNPILAWQPLPEPYKAESEDK